DSARSRDACIPAIPEPTTSTAPVLLVFVIFAPHIHSRIYIYYIHKSFPFTKETLKPRVKTRGQGPKIL
ncbi:hypothetical protein, partial [Desulforamulus aeronauticus]|uniref:hypothetical protein n=1 Tax=Desulforamulus aeronauticus TaxID=53343 RepID=UPI001A9A6557